MFYNIGDRVMYSESTITFGHNVECEIIALFESYIGNTLQQVKVVLALTGSTGSFPKYYKSLTPDEAVIIRASWNKFSSALDGRDVLCYNGGSPFLNIYDSHFSAPFSGNNPEQIKLKNDGEEDRGGLQYI